MDNVREPGHTDSNTGDKMSRKVAVITGGNSGVGFSVADRLLTEYGDIHICLACRNKDRAENAMRDLVQKHPGADISVVLMDTSSIKSVLEASDILRKRFNRLDFLFLNAGMMKVSSINLSRVLAIFSSLDGVKILRTGEGCLNHVDNVTEEGLQEVFATNLFGHFVMVRELEDKMGPSTPTLVIWTSSQNADARFLDLEDIQHKKGKEPYSSSKYAMDMLSVGLNKRYNSKRIYSVSTCPGLVLSNMTYGIKAEWIWRLILPFFFLMRLFVRSFTMSPYNGAESSIWATKQIAESLDPRTKYYSYCNIFGQLWVGREKLMMAEEDIDNLYNQLDQLYKELKGKYHQDIPVNGYTVNCQATNWRNGSVETDI